MILLFILNIASFNIVATSNIDLSVFTESDVQGRFIYNATMVNSSGLQYTDLDHYVYKDYGTDFFIGAYNFSFESNVTWYDDLPLCGGIFMLSNSLHDLKDMKATSDYLAVYWLRPSDVGYPFWIFLETKDNHSQLNMDYRIYKNYYFTLNRTTPIAGNCTFTLKIYNDSNHQDLNDTLSIVTPSYNYRYMYCAYSYGAVSPNNKRITLESRNYTSDFFANLNVLTNENTNVGETTATLNGYLDDSNDSATTVRFQYGTTYAFGTNTTNQTIPVGTSFYNNITGLNPGKVYYYRAYANNSYSLKDWGDNKTFLTKPNPPTYVTITFPNSTYITLNWTKGTGANNTIVLEKTTGIPTSVTDGTIIYNGTGTYTTQPINIGQSIYYAAWSYSNWTDPYLYCYSINGTNFSFGGLYINCFDETTNANLTFNVTITNTDGTNVYTAINCVNTHNINASLCPQGDNINILISSTGHSQRVYTLDISPDIICLLNAYLPNTTATIQLCRIDVVGPQTEYGANPPIENAYVVLKEYDNATGLYQTITSFYTDANGQYFIYLMVNSQYLINISNIDYNTETSVFIVQPDVVVYTFRLSPTTVIVTPSYDLFSVNISFVCTMLDAGGYNQLGNITIAYNDVNLSTINTDIYLYSYYNGTLTYINTWHNTTNTIGLTVGSINTTLTHVAKLYYNNTASFSDMASPFIVYINPVNIWSEHARFDINERITNIIGPMVINGNIISWADVLAIIPAILVLVLLGPFNTGVAIIGSGLALGLSNAVFAMWFTNAFPLLLVTAMPIIIVVGVLYIMSKQGGDLL
jgi:hypothetical protein